MSTPTSKAGAPTVKKTHYRLYLTCPIGKDGSYFVEITNELGLKLIQALQSRINPANPEPEFSSLMTGLDSPFRALHINLTQVVALEAVEGS
jgi:hypothetical protein